MPTLIRRLAPATLPCLVFLAACSGDKERAAAASAAQPEPVVSGDTVTIAEGQRRRFGLAAAGSSDLAVTLAVPARTVAQLRGARALNEELMLFEDTDAQALYAEYLRGRTTYERTNTQLQRLRELYQRSAVAGKDVVDAESDARQAETTLRETEGKLRQQGYDPAQLGALRAGEILAVADVPENRIGAARKGQVALLKFAAYPGEPMTGTVVAVGETVDPATRTVHVTILLKDPAGRIKPGMFAKAYIAEKTTAALQIPVSAVVSADARDFVFVQIAPGRYVRREVITALDDGRVVEIKSGLAPGDSVVTAGAILLKGLTFGY